MALWLVFILFAHTVAQAPPTLPTEYTAVIQVQMPYINFRMPMRVATGTDTQKISYYDGLEVDVHKARGNYKYAYNNSHRICLYTSPEIGPARQGPGANGGPPVNDLNVTILNFFPDFSRYHLVGDELVGGIMCQRWDTHKHRGTTGIMDDRISFYWDAILGKPVRWHMHSRQKTFDAHTDEWIFDYIDFQPGHPSDTDLALPHECHADPSVAPGAGMSSAAEGILAAAHGLRAPTSSDAAPLLFNSFAHEYGKTYTSQEEREMRRRIFDGNVQTIQDLGQKHAAVATFRGNYFLDMTREEMLRSRGGRRAGGPSREERRSRSAAQRALVHRHVRSLAPGAIPKNFDWRTERPGSVSPVKDQGFCGSCWTFGLMEPIESIQAVRTGQMNVLPEQFAIDCTWDAFNFSQGLAQDGNAGCGGGYSDHGAMEIVRKFGGIVPTAEAYGAYLNVDGYCKDTRLMAAGATVTGWVDVDLWDDAALQDALVTQGSVSIAISVPDALNYYDGGVLNTTDCKCVMADIDHQVVLVGFGSDESSGLDYWLLRNSWSTYWGDKGYFKIARGEFDCCITSEAGYPAIAAVDAVEAAAVPEDDFVVAFL